MHLQMLINCKISRISPQSSLQTTYTYKMLDMSLLTHSVLFFSHILHLKILMCDCTVKFHVRGFVPTSVMSNSNLVFGVQK